MTEKRIKTNSDDCPITIRMPYWLRNAIRQTANEKGITSTAVILNILKSKFIEVLLGLE